MRQTLIKKLVPMAACLALLACSDSEVLYVDLSQTEANEMLSLMYSAGLPGEKLVDTEGTYTVTTSRDAFAESMRLLQANGLPGEQFTSMGDVFEKEGFVSSELEERARFNYALSQEISRTLSDIEGVVIARVHLVLPERERLAKRQSAASASVFIKHRPDVDLSDAVGKIKSIVINGVEGLPYENVTVAFFDSKLYKPATAASGASANDSDPLGAVAPESRSTALASVIPSPGWVLVPLAVLVAGALLLWRRLRLRSVAVADGQGSAK